MLAIERADVCLMMIDANEGVTEQDTKIAGEAHEAGKRCYNSSKQMGRNRKRNRHIRKI